MIVEGITPLRGEVAISGAKNAALPLLCSSLLTTATCTFRNVPALDDIATLTNLFHTLGANSIFSDEQHTLRLTTNHLQHFEATSDLVKAIRASILLLGPLVARYGRVRLALPGGDAIGARPVDQHLRGLASMGANITMEQGCIVAKARRLHGASIHLDMPTVTGTENLLMAATLAKGTTVLKNAAKEPEVEDLAKALRLMGARIEGEGTSTIYIEGADELFPIEYTVMPDRIEAGTFLVAACLTQGEVNITNCNPFHMESALNLLKQAGATIEVSETSVFIRCPRRLNPLHIKTEPYPGFPTDLQAQFLTLACLAQGESTVHETIFENRFMHALELQKMGARINLNGRVATIQGIEHFTKAQVKGTDLRASASLVLAGLSAKGATTVEGIDHLDRGYERMEAKLTKLGARISRGKSFSEQTA